MKYRIKVKEDGYFYPQYKGWLFWHGFLQPLITGDYCSVSCSTEEEANIWLTRKVADNIKANKRMLENIKNVRVIEWKP